MGCKCRTKRGAPRSLIYRTLLTGDNPHIRSFPQENLCLQIETDRVSLTWTTRLTRISSHFCLLSRYYFLLWNFDGKKLIWIAQSSNSQNNDEIDFPTLTLLLMYLPKISELYSSYLLSLPILLNYSSINNTINIFVRLV